MLKSKIEEAITSFQIHTKENRKNTTRFSFAKFWFKIMIEIIAVAQKHAAYKYLICLIQ